MPKGCFENPFRTPFHQIRNLIIQVAKIQSHKTLNKKCDLSFY